MLYCHGNVSFLFHVWFAKWLEQPFVDLGVKRWRRGSYFTLGPRGMFLWATSPVQLQSCPISMHQVWDILRLPVKPSDWALSEVVFVRPSQLRRRRLGWGLHAGWEKIDCNLETLAAATVWIPTNCLARSHCTDEKTEGEDHGPLPRPWVASVY